MACHGLEALTNQLGESPPEAVAALPTERLEHLAEAVRVARRRQAAELSAAGNQALQKLPRILRAPIRRLVG
jgi:hypothetical protein